MIHQALKQFEIDLERSYVIGDKSADLGLAEKVGAQGILVRTGYGEAEAGRLTAGSASLPNPVFIADTLMDATSWILEQQVGRRNAES